MDTIQPVTLAVAESEGYVLVYQERIPVEEVDRVLEAIAPLFPNTEARNTFLWRCGRLSEMHGRLDEACRYIDVVQSQLRKDDDEHLAACILAKGGLQEKRGNFTKAVEIYRTAFDLPIRNDETWYFMFNNLGYSLGKLGNYAEAEDFCRAAIILDLDRHNAHRNLGLALEGQQKYVEAAECFIRAIVRRPEDPRALVRLKAMVVRVPELTRQAPEIVAWLHEYRLKTEEARGDA